jgi:hypothetical protein
VNSVDKESTSPLFVSSERGIPRNEYASNDFPIKSFTELEMDPTRT